MRQDFNERGGIFLCLFCNKSDVTMVSGNELQVTAIELFDEKELAV